MADRAKYIQLGVANGVTSLDEIKNTYNKYAEGGPKRVRANTSPTAELSTKLEDVVATKIRNDKRINHAYDIPYLEDKETKIIGYTVPTNALDSIAKYAGKTKHDLDEAVALAFESGYGRQPYFNYGTKNISDRAIGNMNYFKNYGSIPSHLFVRDYEYTKGGYNKDKPYTDQAPLEHAINFFRSGRYNTKLRAVDPETGKTINHTQKVKLEAKKLRKDPNYQKWKKQSGLDEYTGKAQKARDRQKAIDAENARKAKYRKEHPIKAYFKDVLGIKYDDGGLLTKADELTYRNPSLVSDIHPLPEDVLIGEDYFSRRYKRPDGSTYSYVPTYDKDIPTVVGYAPIRLNTYYPIVSKYPFTGHSSLEIPVDREAFYGPGSNEYINTLPRISIDKLGSAKDYNLVTNNCADATLKALNTLYNTNEKANLFTTPGDVRDLAIKLGGRVVKNGDGSDTVLIPRNKDNYKEISNKALEIYETNDDASINFSMRNKHATGGSITKEGNNPTDDRIISTGNDWVDMGLGFVPFVGSAMDWEEAVRNPSVLNYLTAAGSTVLDFFGGSLVKGALKTVGKAKDATDVVKKMNKAKTKYERSAHNMQKAVDSGQQNITKLRKQTNRNYNDYLKVQQDAKNLNKVKKAGYYRNNAGKWKYMPERYEGPGDWSEIVNPYTIYGTDAGLNTIQYLYPQE